MKGPTSGLRRSPALRASLSQADRRPMRVCLLTVCTRSTARSGTDRRRSEHVIYFHVRRRRSGDGGRRDINAGGRRASLSTDAMEIEAPFFAKEKRPRRPNPPFVDDASLRRIRRQETWTARILRSGDRDSVEAAEREWWASTSPSERVNMVDAVSADAFGLLGIDAHELRLQRSVTRIRRRRS